MAQEDLTLDEVIARACVRAVPARKFIKLVNSWLLRHDLEGQDAEEHTAAALLAQLGATSSPPAILFGYLAQSLAAPIISARTLIIHLLFVISDGASFSTSLLVSISSLVLTNPTLLDPANPLPSSLVRPASLVPDIGTSASAQSSSESVSTLGLILPLLRQCTAPSVPTPLIALINRLLVLLQPYPAPPLDIGLEAGSLFGSLPETISVPLRDCLSGLMADLAISQETTSASVLPPPALAPVTNGHTVPEKPPDGEASTTAFSIPPLPPFNTQIPLASAMTFTLTLLLRSDRWTISDPTSSSIPENHMDLLRIAPHISPDPETFLQHLVRAALCGCAVEYAGPTKEGIRRWMFVVERLPLFLKWWKENSTPKWPYPDNLRSALSSAFVSEKSSISAYNSWVSATFTSLSQAEPEFFSDCWICPDGWMLCSLDVSLLQRLLEQGLLQKADTSAILPGMSIPSVAVWDLLTPRVASSAKPHLKPLGHVTAYSPGGSRALAKDVFNALKQCPTIPMPEGLISNLAHDPGLLACLGGNISPATWLAEIRSRLLEVPYDPAARQEDPQGSLTRFGEGVLFAEAFVARFKMPLPDLLDDARRAVSFGDLDASQRSCVNGWIKALFGSEGIDDEIILATSPADFYRLAPGIIQQAVIAAASGEIDLETLHGGLSYFSQPLLSWSLVGITAWLASEIERNGLLAALHLNVLQNIVLSSSFPESILHVTGPAIARLLNPALGLEPVFLSSSFDVTGMRNRLTAAGIVIESVKSLRPREGLRTELASLRTIDLVSRTWSSTICDALDWSIRLEGIGSTLTTIVKELLNSPAGGVGNSLIYIGVLIVVNRLSFTDQRLIGPFINGSIPLLFDSSTTVLNQPSKVVAATEKACQVLKYSLLVCADLDIKEGQRLVDVLLEELAYQRARPVKQRDERRDSKRRRSHLKEPRPVDAEVKRALEAIAANLGADEELRGKWECFGELE